MHTGFPLFRVFSSKEHQRVPMKDSPPLKKKRDVHQSNSRKRMFSLSLSLCLFLT